MTRPDLLLLARGRARFTGDLPLPADGLHGCPATSPHAHARFTRVDAAAALAVPGVVAVLTAADVPGVNDAGNLAPEELLPADTVHCVGQPFALVVAATEEAARAAAALVAADWEPRPAVLDAREAARRGDFLQPPRVVACGDVDAAWASCTTIVSGEVSLGAAEHAALEPQVALAVPTDVGLLVHSSTQSPSSTQAAIARVTGLPAALVEVDVARLGGGFGGKEEQATPWACLAAVAARHTGRAVRVALDRPADFRITGKRHPYTADFRLGLDADARFVAYEVTLRQDGGCTLDLSPAVLDRSLFHATNAYAIPHVRVTGLSCRTNTPSNTAFRGFGAPQAMFVVEAAVRAAARTLGVRPEEVQARNLLAEGDVLPYGQRIERARARGTWDALAARRDPDAVRADVDAWNAAEPRVRKGVAVVPVCFGIAFTATALNQAEALVHVHLDGSVAVTTGAVEMGQGVHGKIRTVVARTLGVAEDLVTVTTTNTGRVANVSPTAASTGADLNGAAAREACRAILAQLAPGEGSAAGWTQRVREAYAQRRSLSALAHHATPALTPSHPFAYHVFGAALVEAEVDVLLGTGRVSRITIAHDLGESLDLATDLGQVEGAVVQGVGWMTTEEILRDHAGRLVTDTFATYKVPDLPDAPLLDVELVEQPEPAGLLGGKAVGEPPLVYGLGAFFALQDAVASYAPAAADRFDAPLTAERLFGLLHGVGDG